MGLKLPEERIWVCGHISPNGLCLSRKQIDERKDRPDWTGRMYAFDLIFRKGKLLPHAESALGPILDEMTSEDLYIKSVNAIDPAGKAGVLLAARSTGGSIGMVLQAQKKNKFKMIIPVGLEKKIPIPLSQALAAAAKTQRAQGIPCGLWQLRGKILTEIEAFRLLCDVEAIPISSGGVCGAEGAIVWVLTGEEKNVEKAYNLCTQIRALGYKFPYELDVYNCKECPKDVCDFAGAKKVKKD